MFTKEETEGRFCIIAKELRHPEFVFNDFGNVSFKSRVMLIEREVEKRGGKILQWRSKTVFEQDAREYHTVIGVLTDKPATNASN